MSSGLLIDALVLVAIALFAWGGSQLGGQVSILRTVSTLVAVCVAVLARDPAGHLVSEALQSSADFGRVVGMVLVGIGVFLATTALGKWWFERRRLGRIAAVQRAREAADEEDDPLDDELDDEWIDAELARIERLNTPRIGAVAGGVLGIVWAVGFVAMLVMLPSDSWITRASAASVPGDALIKNERVLRWIDDGFPHYAQTLPKGAKGVRVGDVGAIPLSGHGEIRQRPRDVDVLVRRIENARVDADVRTLAYNTEVADVAARQAKALVEESYLARDVPGGGSTKALASTAFEASSGHSAETVRVAVAWSHSAPNAIVGLLEDTASSKALLDPAVSEIGIGTADAGWFDGRIYVIVLVGTSADAELVEQGEDSSEDDDRVDAESAPTP